MKKRINITISEDVLEKAKMIARKRKSTVSALIESALSSISMLEEEKRPFSAYLRQLHAPKTRIPKILILKNHIRKKNSCYEDFIGYQYLS